MSSPDRLRSDDLIVASHSGPLSGTVEVPGAKNSVLKLMAATLLAEGRHVITNAPVITDVDLMADLLGALGLTISLEHAAPGEIGQRIVIDNDGALEHAAPFHLADRIRAELG